MIPRSIWRWMILDIKRKKREKRIQLTAVFYFHVDIRTHLSDTFNGTEKTFGFRRFIIVGVGGTLHFDIIYNLYHSFLCVRFLRMKEIKQRDYCHTDEYKY